MLTAFYPLNFQDILKDRNVRIGNLSFVETFWTS